MRFNVAQLLQEPTGAVRWHEVRETAAVWEGFRVRQLEGWLKLTRTDRGIWAQGRLAAETTVECSRCLAPVDELLETEFSEQFYPLADFATGADAALMLEDEAFSIEADQELDVREACRQNLLTRLSLQPLCKADCAGLCPGCGVDRNAAACRCGPP